MCTQERNNVETYLGHDFPWHNSHRIVVPVDRTHKYRSVRGTAMLWKRRTNYWKNSRAVWTGNRHVGPCECKFCPFFFLSLFLAETNVRTRGGGYLFTYIHVFAGRHLGTCPSSCAATCTCTCTYTSHVFVSIGGRVSHWPLLLYTEHSVVYKGELFRTGTQNREGVIPWYALHTTGANLFLHFFSSSSPHCRHAVIASGGRCLVRQSVSQGVATRRPQNPRHLPVFSLTRTPAS